MAVLTLFSLFADSVDSGTSPNVINFVDILSGKVEIDDDFDDEDNVDGVGASVEKVRYHQCIRLEIFYFVFKYYNNP